ncbi:MAG: saccharopine dehydrogenase-like oxidoreductase, partial [Nostoc sp.]
KREMILVAAADHKGYAYAAEGLNTQECIATYQSQDSVGHLEPVGTLTNQSIQDLIEIAQSVDGYFLALPNLPNDFIPTVAKQFIKSGWRGVLVDAIKRTTAVEQLLAMKEELEAA